LHDDDGSLTAFTGDLLLQTSSSNTGAKVALVNGGNTRLETTSTGIDVTGTVEADNFLVDTGGYIAFEGEGSTDFASIRTVIDNDNGITNLDFRLGDDDGDAFRWMFNHHINFGYREFMRLDVDTTDPNREQGTLRLEGTVSAHRFSADWEKADAESWSSFARDGNSNVLYVMQGQTDVDIASFRKGSTQPGSNGTEVLGVKHDGIEVTGDVEVKDSADGVILNSPDGSRFRITVGNDGTLSTTEL
jgi:hypothetical protein